MRKREEILQKFIEQEDYTKQKINSGIEENRKGYFKITVPNGKNIRIKAVQKDHEFKFGANLFMLDELETPEKNEMYKEYFKDLFNMATLPFYWDTLEPEQGKPRYDKNSPKVYRRPAPDLCIEFCEKYEIEPREHALAYDGFFPDWLRGKSDFEVKKALIRRYKEISERYADKIPTIEVTNETFWGPKRCTTDFYNSDEFVEWCFKTAEKHFPANELTINETTGNTWGDDKLNRSRYFMQIERAIAKGARIDAIGMQYHMFFRAEDEIEKTKDFYYNPHHLYGIMDNYSKFNLPLQVTEVTIPAYSYNAEDEDLQAEILKNLYSIWFSYKNIEQIVYWNVVDGYAHVWDPALIKGSQGNMSLGENVYYGGLVRFDFTKKPSYNTLFNLIHKEWKTNTEIITDDNGIAEFKGFYGKYDITFEAGGKTYTKEINCSKNSKNDFKIEL